MHIYEFFFYSGHNITYMIILITTTYAEGIGKPLVLRIKREMFYKITIIAHCIHDKIFYVLSLKYLQ